MKYFLFCLFCISLVSGTAMGQAQLTELKTEYQATPLGIGTITPRFSWQMISDKNQKGVFQSAYQIKVKNEKGEHVWDSGKTESGEAIGISYAGEELLPMHRYRWEVKVWDQDNSITSKESFFETGLMDDTINGWKGAKWIGSDELVFYSHYLSVFKFSYAVQLEEDSNSEKAAFVFGANDRRLQNRNLNIQDVQSGENESFIAFELDISEIINSDGHAQLHIYRVGYAKEDQLETPFKSFQIPKKLIHKDNLYKKHQVFAECNFGVFQIYIDGQANENQVTEFDPNAPRYIQQGLNLNPVGAGNNFISYPMLADIGFWIKPGQKAVFSEIEIRNFREPSNLLFEENPKIVLEYTGAFKRFLSEENFNVKDGFLLQGLDDGFLALIDPSKNAAPMLRTVFETTNKKITKARIYATARGIYELYLNGEKVGNDYFNPGLTQYDKHHMYQTFDVTELVKSDTENVLGAWLSEGWWSGNITYSGENWNYFGDRQSFLGMLQIDYEDGTSETILTKPENWQMYQNGPIRYGSFFQGEVYDAGLESKIDGWNQAGFDDSSWEQAKEIPLDGTAFIASESSNAEVITGYDLLKLISQQGNSPKLVKTLTAQRVSEVRPGVFVYDMGQNMVGFPQVELRNNQPGQEIIFRYAEVTYPDLPEHENQVGMVMLENIRAALTQDIYITKGGEETFQPRFTFHGYRYVEISGIENAIPIENVKGMVISSIDTLTASYETSNDLVNKLWENITWSMRGNFLSIPTDTPARNERMGWSGDINVFSRTATFMANTNSFLKQHLMSMRDIQQESGRFPDVAPVGGGFGGTLWGSAGIIVPWETYQQYGDIQLLEEHYEAMEDYIAFLESKQNEEGILNEGPLGDWLSPEGDKNDNTLFWTAYQVYCLDIMERTSHVLDKKEKATTYKRKKEHRKDFFNTMYLNETGKTVKSGFKVATLGPPNASQSASVSDKGQPVDTQASYAIPLALNVVADSKKEAVIAHLANSIERTNVDDSGVERPEYSLMTGFIGTASLGESLSENGRIDLVYKLLQKTSYPSWLYSVVNGATTIWERLNSYTVEDGFGGNNSMNSFNHYSFGAIGAWMINYSLGIQRDETSPGFKHFYLQPTPDPTGDMTWAKGHYDGMYGRIESGWRVENQTYTYQFTVPANTSATLILKLNENQKISINGSKLRDSEMVEVLEENEREVKVNIKSGKYTFIVK